MRPVTSLPGTVVRALHCHRTSGGVIGPRGTVTWLEVAAEARAMALGMSGEGLSAGARVITDAVPTARTLAAELSMLAVGATVVVPSAVAAGNGAAGQAAAEPVAWRWTVDGLVGPRGTTSSADLVAAGRKVDEAEPDLFERLLATVDPDGAAFAQHDIDGRLIPVDHHAALDLLRSLDRAMQPTVRADAGSSPVSVVVGRGRWGLPQRLVGLWWPALHGGSTTVDGSDLPASVADAHPELIVADGPRWDEVAAAVRRHPRLTAGTRLGRIILGGGRAAAAGESAGWLTSGIRRAAAAAVRAEVRTDLGLDRCRLAVALAPLAEASRRDLLGIGVPLAIAWVPEGSPGPVTMTTVGTPDRSAGRPLPGWSVAIGDGGRVVIDGPGLSNRDTSCTGRLDGDHRLWLGSGPR